MPELNIDISNCGTLGGAEGSGGEGSGGEIIGVSITTGVSLVASRGVVGVEVEKLGDISRVGLWGVTGEDSRS